MSNAYRPLPTIDTDADRRSSSIDRNDVNDPSHRPLRASVQAEFDRPPPSWYKRAGLILAIIIMGWLAIKLGSNPADKAPKVIYASRYSEEHKYRPAASPVITEYLKDGRMRLRGASVGGVGIREEDLPMSPERKAIEEKKRIDEAREAAREKLKSNKKKSSKSTKGKKKKGKKAKAEM